MDLSCVEARDRTGEVVVVDPGNYWRKYCRATNETWPHDGFRGIVVEVVPNNRSGRWRGGSTLGTYKIEGLDGTIVYEHWSSVRSASPLEALAFYGASEDED